MSIRGMGTGATDSEVLEKKLEKRLQDPRTEPLVSLPLYFLEDITSSFSNERELGRGACGIVYKGVLGSGKTIAVKKIINTHLLVNDNQVKNEIIYLTEVMHQNVVQLLGYCVETKSEVVEHNGRYIMAESRACLLCFEFLCNGSLDKHLDDKTLVLDWDKRYKIIRAICNGLHYLHDECHMVHLDLKPQNILMDATRMPKIADFGLSRLLGEQKSKIITESRAGTPGYMAQEYLDHGIISPKADIFSLGVIIIEIITGCRLYPNISNTKTSLKHYADEVVRSWRKRIIEMTPMQISPEVCIKQVEQCISIALKCLEPESNKRPASLDIVQSLSAVEPKCMSLGNPPSVVQKDRGNQNLQSQANVNIINIPKITSAINSLNECANLFHWVNVAISSQSNETKKDIVNGDIHLLHSDLQCLTDTLPGMYELINRAEWRIHDRSVAELLSRLKDAVYDAEDILDEFRWYEIKLSVEGNAISVESVIDFFYGVTQGSPNKVNDIQKRLNHLSGQLEKMGLLQVAIQRFDRSLRPETTTFCTESMIFGRDVEKKKLIRLLGVPSNNSMIPSGHKRNRSGVCSSESNRICATIDSNETTVTSVPVLPIVGIGGVGKTTLAQEIYNLPKLKHHFHLKIWICVSDDFEVKRLTKEALEQSCEKVPQSDSLNRLQTSLANSLNTKRVLLILDDMWDVKEEEWKHFCAPFRNMLQGSMMLVTTRLQKVANVVGTMDSFPLEGLTEDIFRKFFKQCVFVSDSSNSNPELEQICEKILPKLKGSPLAAKTLGRLLRNERDPLRWEEILNSQLWEIRQEGTDILPALRLSYMYLPFYLKRCFSFCAVYPKDYSFRKKDLAEVWVAEGLVENQHIGDQYFEELVHLSFFQKYPRSQEKYVIHDLMHDMAQLVSKDECFILKYVKDIPKIPQNVRHLSVLKGGDIQICHLLEPGQHRKLRTLICDLSLKKHDSSVMEKWCAKFSCMRVMVCFSISKQGLPDSISNMKHLRYLKILDSCCCKSLPAKFCHLYNMQIFYAEKWVIDEMPSGFGMLINLQKFKSKSCQFHHRHIHSVDVRESASKTDKMDINEFRLESYNGETPPSWSHLQNSENIDNTKSTFSSLNDVTIMACRNLLSLEQFLQPAYMPVIKKILISGCESLQSVPTDRFGDFCFLDRLKVFNCPKIESQHLFAPYLKELRLDSSGKLGGNIECSSLTILSLCNCPLESIELQMWDLPLMQELSISSCPSLTIIKDSEVISSDLSLGGARSNENCRTGKFPKLAELTILSCRKLETIDNLIYVPTIKSINIDDCGLLSLPAHRFGSFPCLTHLEITSCPSLNWQSGILLPSSLQKLTLCDCGDFSAWFPSFLENLTSLEALQICNCACIVSVPGHLWSSNLKSVTGLKFDSCPKLKSIGGPGTTAHITNLFIDKCPELMEINQPMKRGSSWF